MTDGLLIAGFGFIATLIAVISPVLKLNASIVKLNVKLDHMIENDAVRDRRITKHGEEIESMIERQRSNEKILANHDYRISNIEKELEEHKHECY